MNIKIAKDEQRKLDYHTQNYIEFGSGEEEL